MSGKNERFVRFALHELAAMEALGEIRTDWAKAAEQPVPDGSDPDDMIEDVDMDHVSTTWPPVFRRPAD